MTFFHQFNVFAASRNEGLHPKLRDLLERASASPFSVVSLRHDGMSQAGPSPVSEVVSSRVNVTPFSRERAREDLDPDALDALHSPALPADEQLDLRRARALLDVVLNEMSDELRTVFVLFELEDMTMATIAELLHLPPGTVASRLRRARATFELEATKLSQIGNQA